MFASTDGKSLTTHTRSSVIVCELDLIHCITVYDRLSKVRLMIWRRSLSRDWLGRSVSVKKKNTHRARSGDDHLQEGLRSYVFSCEVFLINVSHQAVKSGKDNLWAQKYVTSFFRIRPFIFTVVDTMIHVKEIYCCSERHGNNHQCIFPIIFHCPFFSTDPLSDRSFDIEDLVSSRINLILVRVTSPLTRL